MSYAQSTAKGRIKVKQNIFLPQIQILIHYFNIHIPPLKIGDLREMGGRGGGGDSYKGVAPLLHWRLERVGEGEGEGGGGGNSYNGVAPLLHS